MADLRPALASGHLLAKQGSERNVALQRVNGNDVGTAGMHHVTERQSDASARQDSLVRSERNRSSESADKRHEVGLRTQTGTPADNA